MSTELWLKQPTDIGSILSKFYMSRMISGVTLADLESKVAKARDAIVVAGVNPRNMQWGTLFIVVAGMTLTLLGNQFDENQFIRLLLDKHRRYGTKSITAWRELGILTRIDQKIARLVNMTNDPTLDHGDETLQDTLVDIVGYCVLGYYIVNNLPKD